MISWNSWTQLAFWVAPIRGNPLVPSYLASVTVQLTTIEYEMIDEVGQEIGAVREAEIRGCGMSPRDVYASFLGWSDFSEIGAYALELVVRGVIRAWQREIAPWTDVDAPI